MPKKNFLLFILIITVILHSSVTSAQEVKERAMVVYSKKNKSLSKAKTFAAFVDFGTSLFMRQDPALPDLSECNPSLDLDISYGYFINSYFYIGPGAGIRAYFGENFTMFPIFGELRGCWKWTFIYGKGGFSLSTSGNNDRGGAYASIGLGVNFISKTKYKLFLSMGYEFQDHRRKDTSVLRKEILTGKNGIAIRIGTQF